MEKKKLIKFILEDCGINNEKFTAELSEEKERIFIKVGVEDFVIRIWSQKDNHKRRIIIRYTLFGNEIIKKGKIIKKKKDCYKN
jgi:hypothetical protein